MADLITLERAAYRRDPDRVDRLFDTIDSALGGGVIEDGARPGAPRLSSTIMATRIASAVAAIFSDPALTLNDAELGRALVLKSVLDRIFPASGFGSSDFLLQAMPGGDQVRRLVLQSLDSELDLPMEAIAGLPSTLGQQVLASVVASQPLTTVRGFERRNRLLEMAGALGPAEVPLRLSQLVVLANAWMICSYASTPRKHEIKRLLNGTLRNFAQRLGIVDDEPRTRRPLADRPVMVVAAEIMNSHHVQYRYFGQYLRQLRERFELVLVTDRREVDPAVEALFEEVRAFERSANGAHLSTIGKTIKAIAPDILFYPSVGMRHWGPLMANVRFAPIQFTALGHSASTFCPTMDYYLLEEGYVSDPALIGETAVMLPDESLVFERSPHYTPVAPEIRPSPSRLRVAVPSNLLKLNPPFLELLGRIQRSTRRPLDFHFFPAAAGMEADVFEAAVRRVLAGPVVHRNLAYPRYLQAISACDLNLSPFPFGGLHSVVDSLRQGLPVVAMECPELHGRTDAMLLRRLGMPDWLIARDQDAYVAAALHVIEDDETRVALSRQALALDIDHTLFGDAGTPLRREVVDAVSWLYENHEAVMASGRKAWTMQDRKAWTS